MSDKKFIITISSGVEDEAADVSLETWKIDETAAMGYRRALTDKHGEPMTGIVSAQAINTMDQGPGVVLLTEGDQAGPRHFMAKDDRRDNGVIICSCGVVFDGIDPMGDLERHMEAENPSQK